MRRWSRGKPGHITGGGPLHGHTNVVPGHPLAKLNWISPKKTNRHKKGHPLAKFNWISPKKKQTCIKMLKVIGQPWCGESVRIVKLGHLGLVQVSYNPVHVILREEFSFPRKYQRDLVLYCYLSRPCVAWGGPASCWKSLNISLSDQVFEHWPDMRAVLGSAEEAPVKVVLSKETLFVAVVRLSS